jgi:SRSO17 transposase
VFAAVRLAAIRSIRARAERAALRTRRLDLQQELSEAASEVMVVDPNEGPEKARLRASTAEQYLQTLTAFEAARTRTDLDAAQTGFTALATSVAELRRGPEKVPEAAHPARGHRWWRNR